MHPAELPDEPTPLPVKPSSHSGQWGLTSILLSSLVLLLFPLFVALLLAGMVLAYHNAFLESRDLDLAIFGFKLCIWGFIVLATIALACGLTGFISGLARKQPLGLSTGGLLVSLLALTTSILLLVISNRCAEWTRWLQRQRFGPDGDRLPAPPFRR